MSQPGLIEAEPQGVCDLCDKVAETRPYGPNGEEICFQCGQRDVVTTEKSMGQFLFGAKP
jgi:hypothetical protein